MVTPEMIAAMHEIEISNPEKAKFDPMFDYINEPLLLFAADEQGMAWKLIDLNQAAVTKFGYSKAELLQEGATLLAPAGMEKQWLPEAWYKPGKNAIKMESVAQTRNGKKLMVEIGARMFNLHGTRCIMAMVRDISLQKQVERNLKRYHALANNMYIGIYLVSRDNRPRFVNPAFENIMGRSAWRFGDHFIDAMAMCLAPEDRDHYRQSVNNVLQQARPQETTYRIVRPDGEIRFVRDCMQVLTDDDGEIFLQGLIADITEEYRAKEELEISERKFREVTENMLDIITRTDVEGKIIYVSPSITDVIGFLPEQYLDKPFLELVDPRDREKVKLAVRESFARKESARVEHRSCDHRGRPVYLETVINFLFDDQGECTGGIGVTRDISSRKRLEAEMIRLDRLRVLGEMAAGIAHEIRNPMTTVKGFIQMYLSDPRFAAEKENLELMIEELERGNTIITEFLSLSRSRSSDMRTQDLNDVIRSVYPILLAEGTRSDCNVVLDLNQVPLLQLDGRQIRQLLMNLTRNAFEAMPSGGCLHIRTYCDNSGVFLVVQDEGPGIPQEVLDKIGTPFLTTKENGTGLGLLIAFTIIESHGGRIDVETGPRGTTFYIQFPGRGNIPD